MSTTQKVTGILAGGIAITFSLTSCNSERKPEKPNIVFIFADDMTFRSINSLGNSEVQAPNIDYLVRNGTTFTHTYNMGGWNGAICVASRAQLITGSFIWRAQKEDGMMRKDSVLHRPLWGNLMKEAGYETYFTGKWHIREDVAKVFDHVVHERPGMPNQTEIGYNRPLSSNDTTWRAWDTTNGGHWKGGKHWSEVLGDDAVSYLESASAIEKPFFMYLAFNAPHDPRQSPRSFIEKYPLENISVPVNFQPLYPDKELIGCGEDLRDEMLAPFPRTEYAIKVNRQEYYALITHMDQQIGRILEAIKKTGKENNTYIIFTADNGLNIGEQGLMGKQNMYECSMRVPFIIVGPDIPKDKKVDADIYLQDAMATSLELAGVEKPAFIDFNSILKLARGEETVSQYPAIYGCYMDFQRMIRKDGYKLIVYPGAKKMLLYEVNTDPMEMNNLAEKPDYKEKRKTLFLDLIALQKEMNDPLDLTTIFPVE